ncbi:copper amine oxidase N-terminal domain-containing protein [Gorillibacterium timonense]|uniref:copper amine oxidase N-terminal domain-containing protein n=1 Tax=Gorillibacterium timonense TaxID=1689269 RepID=UPI00071DD6BB|nr:copper amine oxidase N-terminal domain-containing protein [Gorillibacterium timonense]
MPRNKSKKKPLLLALLAITLLVPAPYSYGAAAYTNTEITVTQGGIAIQIDGKALKLSDSARLPFVYQGTTYLPVRSIAEAFGKNVAWDAKTSTLSLSGNKTLSESDDWYDYYYRETKKLSVSFLPLSVQIDGKLAASSLPAILTNGTTYLPMRAMAGLLGVELEWDAANSTVYLYNPIAHVQTVRMAAPASLLSTIDRGSDFLSSYSNLTPSVASVVDAAGAVHVAWVDSDKLPRLHLDTYDSTLRKLSSFSLAMEMPLFGSFTLDEQGNVYVLCGKRMEENESALPSVKISKYSPEGTKLGETAFEAGKQSAKGTKEPFNFANAKLRCQNGLVVAFFGRVMFQSGDGLNHQSSTALYVNAATMQEVTLPIPYSSHSFDQDILFDGDNLIFAERGDVYDRGFTLTKVNRLLNKLDSVTPFSFKNGTAAYQLTFSELGGIASASNGYVLVGSSEKTMSASKAGSHHNESRNLFLQLVSKQFENGSEPVLSKGDTQEFHVSVHGWDYTASNKGVVWLTDYKEKAFENAAHPKVTALGGDRFLILWEKMGATKANPELLTYLTTFYMIVSSDGSVISPAKEIRGARLNMGDSVTYRDGSVYWASTNDRGLVVYKLTDVD